MPPMPSSAASRITSTGKVLRLVPFERVRRDLLGGEVARHVADRRVWSSFR